MVDINEYKQAKELEQQKLLNQIYEEMDAEQARYNMKVDNGVATSEDLVNWLKEIAECKKRISAIKKK